MDLEKFEAVLEAFCEWAGKSKEEYVREATFERLKGDLEEISSYGIPRAEWMLRELLEVKL